MIGKFVVSAFMDDFGNAVYPYQLESYLHRYEFFLNNGVYFDSKK